MSDEYDYSTEDGVVGLDASGEALVDNKTEWLKFTKGQIVRAALVFFHPVNRVAADNAKTQNPSLSTEERRRIGSQALSAHAKKLGKDKLAPWETLDLTEAKFNAFKFHYQEGMGYFLSRLGKEGADSDKVWKMIEEPKQGFSTLLLIYPTNAKGEVDVRDDAKKKALATEWRLVPWRFGKKTFDDLLKTNRGLRENGMSIAGQDLRIECKDSQYQNVSISFVGKAIWQQSAQFRENVLTAAIPKYDELIPFRELSTDALRSKLGLVTPAVSDVSLNVGDFSDVLSTV